MYVGLFGHSAVVFHVFMFYWLFAWLCFFQWHFTDLCGCIAASLFNKLTYLLTNTVLETLTCLVACASGRSACWCGSWWLAALCRTPTLTTGKYRTSSSPANDSSSLSTAPTACTPRTCDRSVAGQLSLLNLCIRDEVHVFTAYAACFIMRT